MSSVWSEPKRTTIADVNGDQPTLNVAGQVYRFPSRINPVGPPVRFEYRPLRLTARGRRLRDGLYLLVICAAIAAVLATAFLYGEHRQTAWCQHHTVQARTVSACQVDSR